MDDIDNYPETRPFKREPFKAVPLRKILNDQSAVEKAVREGDVATLHSLMVDGVFITELALRIAEATDEKLARRLKRYMSLDEDKQLPV